MFVIYEEDRVRVLQHDHLHVFNVQEFGALDSSNMHWYTVKQVFSIEEVRELVKEIWDRKSEVLS